MSDLYLLDATMLLNRLQYDRQIVLNEDYDGDDEIKTLLVTKELLTKNDLMHMKSNGQEPDSALNWIVKRRVTGYFALQDAWPIQSAEGLSIHLIDHVFMADMLRLNLTCMLDHRMLMANSVHDLPTITDPNVNQAMLAYYNKIKIQNSLKSLLDKCSAAVPGLEPESRQAQRPGRRI